MIVPRGIAVAALACLTLAGCVDNASSGDGDDTTSLEDFEPEYVDGELQPLPDGFPDRPLTIISVDDPGSRDGLYARTLDQALEGLAPVDVIVSDEPRAQGGTVDTVLDTLERDGGEAGYFPIVSSVLGTSTDFHAVPYERDFGVTLDDLDFFIATETYPYVLAQRADAPWGATFEDFVEYGQENPGELRYIAGGVGSGVDVTMGWLLDQLGIEVEKIPAADRDAAMAAVGAGQGDFTLTQPEVATPAEEQGRVDVVMVTTEEVPDEWAAGEGVASAADYADFGIEDATWGTVQGLLLPDEVPDSHKAWLYELFSAAYETDVYQARGESQPAIALQLFTGEEANQVAGELYDFSGPIIQDLGLSWEDQ